MTEYTKALAEFTAKSQLAEELVPLMKKSLLDTLGCAAAGSVRKEIKNMASALLENDESGLAQVWCYGAKAPMSTALVLNGSMSHAVELDDLHKPGKIHAGTVVVPTVITLGALKHISGLEALCAMQTGYEVMLRVALGLGVESHRRRGWHGTATCGNFGAAAAAGKILGLDSLKQANAFGLAGTVAGGLMAYTADGSMSKRYHAGKAAENGYMAAILASCDYTGPVYVLEAKDGGYAKAVSDDFNLDCALEDIGIKWNTAEMGHKYYACCGHIHQAIESALLLRSKYNIKPEDIEKVVVETYDVSGMSWGFEGPPKNSVEAQFSFPYAVSVALVKGRAFIEEFEEAQLSDSGVLELCEKVIVEKKSFYTELYPKAWCSSVRIYLKNSPYVEAESRGAKGDPQKPLSDEEIKEKFTALSSRVFSKSRQRDIIDAVYNIESLEDIALISELMYSR